MYFPQDHRWWWQSFITGGSSAVWVFMYCVWYYFAKMQIQGFISSLLFFSYSVLGCAVYGLLTGTVGFLTAYAFIRRIYRFVVALSFLPRFRLHSANEVHTISSVKVD